MRKVILTITLALSSTVALAGVSSISENGESASGKTAYKIACLDGREWRIWNSDGEWYDGFVAQGGNSRDLNEQAEFLCR